MSTLAEQIRPRIRRVLDQLTEPGVRSLDGMTDELVREIIALLPLQGEGEAVEAILKALEPFAGENWQCMGRDLWPDDEPLTIIDSCGVTIPDKWTVGDFRRAAEAYATMNRSDLSERMTEP